MHGSHRHFHRRRDFFDDVGQFFNGLNPFDPPKGNSKVEGGDDANSDTKSSQGGNQSGVQIVYKTMSPTFKGPVAGYSTVLQDNNPPPTQAPKTQAPEPTKQPDKPKPKEISSEPSSESPKPRPTSSAVPTAIRAPHTSEAVSETVLAKATGSPTASVPIGIDANPALTSGASPIGSATSAADSAGSSSSKSDSGPSAGAKAGIAFGVIGGALIIGLLVFLFIRKRRSQQHQELGDDDEKLHQPFAGATTGGAMAGGAMAGGVAGGAMAAGAVRAAPLPRFPSPSPSPSPEPIEDLPVRSNPNAPRISVRPVSQFNWNLDKTGPVGVAVSSDPSGRPNTSQSDHAANPFGPQAERVPSPPQESGMRTPSPPAVNGEEIAAGAAVGAAVAVGAVALTRKTSMRNQNPNVDLTVNRSLGPVPPSPATTEFSTSSSSPEPMSGTSKSAAAIAAAGGPPNSTVHRVQLDFKPTLEDEMELKAGDLVRLLHEYDDGWALAIRLDRSQQGVVPRTCLSTRPVKPRPAQGRPPVNPSGYPRGPNQPQPYRPMTPQGQQRPMTPQGMYANGAPRMGPAQGPRHGPSASGPPMNPHGAGRPHSPMGPQGQSMSPGPRYQGPPNARPQSPSGMSPKGSPPGSSPMNPAQALPPGPPTGPVGRKPVPGQAL